MRALACVLLLAMAVPAAAQEREIRNANLPRELELELLRMFDGGAERYDGPSVVGPSEVVGDVAVMGGTLRVVGRVEGDVAVVNGDVVVQAGGVVMGDVMVVGGQVRMEDGGEVRGTITAYGEAPRRDRRDDWRRDREGYAKLTLRAGTSYNRVEGLPLMFGPVVRTAGPDPLRLEALAIWRTEAGSLDTDRMGYRLRAEQVLGDGRLGLGGSVYSVIEPMDRWQLSDLEASLGAVLFHHDYRDHYEREGWRVFARFEPTRVVSAELEYRQDDYTTVAPGDPWSLFNGDDVWSAQPVIGEGELQTLGGSLEVDTRDNEDYPWRGWLARLSVARPVGGTLTRPMLTFVHTADGILDVVPAEELDTDFTTALLDVRRYMPVTYSSQIGMRVVAGGALSERPLPAQLQHALGGPGTLPGFDVFSADCGARGGTGRLRDERFFTRYGCDRFVLAQLEYRGDLAVDFGFGDPDHDDEDDWDWHDLHIDFQPEWVVFVDAGQGWSYGDVLDPEPRDTGMRYDAGVGFLMDDLGLYVALPLNDDVEQDPRFFIRLGRRF